MSLLTKLFTTFSTLRLSVHSLRNAKSARELNLAASIVDPSQVFRFSANEIVLSAVAFAVLPELAATSLGILITLGIEINSIVRRFFRY